LESNDVLYGGDVQFSKELESMLNKIFEQILENIKQLKEEGPSGAKNHRLLVLSLFNTILSYGELNADSGSFAGKLFLLAKENGADKTELLIALRTARAKMNRSKFNAGLYEKLSSVI